MTAGPSILAVHPGALGDVILLGHLLKRLTGRVTIVAGGEKADLLVGLGVAQRGVDFDAVDMHEIFADTDLTQCSLPGSLGVHDRLISCFAGGHRAAELRLAAACGAADAAFLPVRPDESVAAHLVDLWCDLLGLPPDGAAVRPWPVPRAWRAAGDAVLPTPRRRYAVLAPGAGSPGKCWPVERFVELGRSASAGGLRPLVVLGPVEMDRWPGEKIAMLREEFPVLVCPALSTLAGVLCGAEVTVANDSGVGHLSAAVGAPTLALFGPTRADHFAPIGASVAVIARAAMEEIRVADVAAAMRRLTA